jgi:uncharacterized protein YjbJ (UPF0337 family)
MHCILNSHQEAQMTWEHVQGDWQRARAKVRERWGKLTDQDLERIGGAKDRLVAALKERYGYEKDKAMKEIEVWAETLEQKISPKPKN